MQSPFILISASRAKKNIIPGNFFCRVEVVYKRFYIFALFYSEVVGPKLVSAPPSTLHVLAPKQTTAHCMNFYYNPAFGNYPKKKVGRISGFLPPSA
jgi:hypothetical protein